MMVNARVHSVLENGVMLSFLTYFTGTVSSSKHLSILINSFSFTFLLFNSTLV